jgi:hypothetical protein
MRRPTKDPYARPAIQTLERLHAELGGKILENKQEHENLAGQMRHVEAVIKMLDPAYSLRAISVKRRQPNPWFKAGHGVPARGGRAQDGHRAVDGARDRGASVGNGQDRSPQQGRAGGPDRIGAGFPAESQG